MTTSTTFDPMAPAVAISRGWLFSDPTLRRRAGWGIAIVFLLIGGYGLWETVKYHILPKRFGVSLPDKIFRSGQMSPFLVERVLRDNKIEVIVDLQRYDPNDWMQQAETEAVNKLGITRYRCGLNGNGTGDIAQYAYAVTLIAAAERAGQRVLVHCAAGAQRTSGVLAMYHLLVRGADPAEVYSEMRRFGWKRKPNDVMEAYLNRHLPELAQELVANGTLKEMPKQLPRMGEPY